MTDRSDIALVVLSGGQDSTTCLFWALNYFKEVHAVTFNYNQRHKIELECAADVFAYAKSLFPDQVKTHEVVALGPILKGTSPLVSDAPLEQYKDAFSLPGGLEKTFVPMRNQLFLTIAANRAYVLGAGNLVTGVCQEDFGGYPDCRQVFIDALEDAINKGTFNGEDGAPDELLIQTPLMDLTKAESVKLAVDLEHAYDALALSHTAYDGAYPPVGNDHATLLRAKGFIEANMPDPLIVRAWADGKMDLPGTPNYADDALVRELALRLPMRNH